LNASLNQMFTLATVVQHIQQTCKTLIQRFKNVNMLFYYH